MREVSGIAAGDESLPGSAVVPVLLGDKIHSYNTIIAHSQASCLKRSYTVRCLTDKKKPLTTLVIRGFE